MVYRRGENTCQTFTELSEQTNVTIPNIHKLTSEAKI